MLVGRAHMLIDVGKEQLDIKVEADVFERVQLGGLEHDQFIVRRLARDRSHLARVK